MSTKKRQDRTSPRSLRSVPDNDATDSATPDPSASGSDHSTAAGKVWLALQDKPGCTAAEIALAAGVSGSTARKALATLAQQGAAIREPSSQRGVADRWRATTPSADATAIATPLPTPSENPSVSDADDASTSAPGARAGTDAAAHTTDHDQPDHDQTRQHRADDDGAVIDAQPQPKTDNPVSGYGDAVSPVADGPGTTPEPRRDSTSLPGPRQRLAPGALRGQVEDWLRDHPEQDFTPGEIGRKLQRSSGAVANALEKLVSTDTATRTHDHPKRYRLRNEPNA